MSAFSEPDPTIAVFGEDLAWPFELDGNGDLATVSGVDNLISAMQIRACTGLGEVPTTPAEGIDLDDYQNGLADDAERQSLIARLTEQYRRDDRLASVDLSARDGDTDGDTVVEITAITKQGFPIETTVPFGGV